MENLKVIGKIVKISEIKTFESGSGKLSFRIDTGEKFNNILEFDLFKNSENLKFLDTFLKFNKLDDKVEVEFQIQTRSWDNQKTGENVLFTSLSCWRCEKTEGVVLDEEKEDLPF